MPVFKRDPSELAGDALSQGLELVGTLVVLGFLGYLLDRAVGTLPLFLLVFSLVGAIGKGVLMIVRYNQAMERHEAQVRRVPR